MDEPLERRAVISGAAQSDIGRRLHRSGLDLTIEAALRAIDDAGLTVDDLAENDCLGAEAGGSSWWIGYNDIGFSNEGNFTWSGAASTTGWRPPLMSKAAPSSTAGRQ